MASTRRSHNRALARYITPLLKSAPSSPGREGKKNFAISFLCRLLFSRPGYPLAVVALVDFRILVDEAAVLLAVTVDCHRRLAPAAALLAVTVGCYRRLAPAVTTVG